MIDCEADIHFQKRVCDCEIPGFSLQRLTKTFCKKNPTATSSLGGEGADDGIQWDPWKRCSMCRTPLLSMIREEVLDSSDSFPWKNKVWRKEKKEKKKPRQTTGIQLRLISCSMLFRSQGLFRCTNCAEVGNGHESQPVCSLSNEGYMQECRVSPHTFSLLGFSRTIRMKQRVFKSFSIPRGQNLTFMRNLISIISKMIWKKEQETFPFQCLIRRIRHVRCTDRTQWTFHL